MENMYLERGRTVLGWPRGSCPQGPSPNTPAAPGPGEGWDAVGPHAWAGGCTGGGSKQPGRGDAPQPRPPVPFLRDGTEAPSQARCSKHRSEGPGGHRISWGQGQAPLGNASPLRDQRPRGQRAGQGERAGTSPSQSNPLRTLIQPHFCTPHPKRQRARDKNPLVPQVHGAPLAA